MSLFIYLHYFGVENLYILKIVTTISAILSFYMILSQNRAELFWTGASVGILWFYWIALSFRYYDLTYLIPLMILFVAIGYGLIFNLLGFFSPIIRALLFSLFSYIQPLNFNWLIPQASLIDSIFGVHWWQFELILLSLALYLVLKGKARYISLLLMLFAIEFNHTPSPMPNANIYISSLKTPQDKKWKESYTEISIKKNFEIINDAISKNYDVVVLSESAYALFLNMEPPLMRKLLKLSKKIAIVTGSLYYDGKDSYNSTYYFVDGEFSVANKVVLVPFGEEVPLPKFISKFINKIIYDGAEDYIAASKPTDVSINGENYRNAVCYEATRDELFIGNPKYMIAITNNAWFTPSIEPTLQWLLLRYFSKKYHTTIIHSANIAKSALIRE